jgi:catalase
MQLIIDIQNSKVSFAQDVLKSLSFVKAVKPLPAKKAKSKEMNLNLSKQTEELYGIFEGINAPDKKEIRKAMYESNN